MHSLFNFVATANPGILTFPEWGWVRDGLKRNLGTVIAYYRKHPKAVRSDHFLVRLLGSINVPQSLEIERYYDNVDALALNMSMALKMTSSIYKGAVFNGTFYGPGSAEILIAHNTDFDPRQASQNWQNLTPVKVLRHPRSDLGLNLPDGFNTGSETGLTVIAINIPMLAVQYRAFRLNEIYVTHGDQESQRSLMQFVHMYVLPNMMASHLDYAVFNRINNFSRGAPLGESRVKHPFALAQGFDRKANELQQGILERFDEVGKNFIGILKSIPAVSGENMEQVMRLPDLAQTLQVDWALTISRLPMLSFLFRESKGGARERDQSEVNRIQRSVQQYKSGNVFRQMLPQDLFYETQNEIDDILMLPSM